MAPYAPTRRPSSWKAKLRSTLALGILALGAAVRADPLDLDFGPLGPSVHDVGPIDVGVNIVRFGNVTAAGIPVLSAATFSVPTGLEIDRMTLTILSYSSSKGALLLANLLSPNAGEVLSFESESEFVGLAINDPSAVTASFRVTPHPDFGGTVDAYWALRIYASGVAAVPEPATGSLLLAGMACLLKARRRRRSQDRPL